MDLYLKHFALGVPDLKAGEAFYEAFGLNPQNRADHLAFRCDGQEEDQVVLLETGRDRQFHHIAFGASDKALAEIAARLEAAGIPRLDPPYAGAPDGLWFNDKDGNLVNVHASPAPAPRKEEAGLVNLPGNRSRLGVRAAFSQPVVARPRRLGHMILFTPRLAEQTAFYREILGLQLSDTIENGYAAFLRTPGASDHHVLGLINSPARGFHHASFEMASIDETEIGARRLLSSGYRHAWGPGRHGVGSNYFHYFRDPWNGLHEYFFDIDYIPAEFDWSPSDWTKKDGMFLWSADGPPPADFGQNYEAA